MNKGLVALAGIGVGAGIMYLVDPREGRRRRARVRELTIHSMHTVKTIAGVTSRDVEHRLSGLAAHMLGRLVEEETRSDDVLVARVRARLGRLVAHPGAIDVTASQGTVTVSGPIFEAEVEQLLEGIGAVPSVTAIENRLEPHREAVHVSALQGPGPREVPRMPASLEAVESNGATDRGRGRACAGGTVLAESTGPGSRDRNRRCRAARTRLVAYPRTGIGGIGSCRLRLRVRGNR
jgi:hypothetical protein